MSILAMSLFLAAVLPNQTASAPTSIDQRINRLLSQMSLEEKVSLCNGQNDMALPAIPRLGIPSLTMSDGPLGARWGKSTAFPANILMGATWDLDLQRRTASAMADEFLGKGRLMILGPCVGLVRVPQGGRNMESYGEDPFLNGQMAAVFVQGAQSRGVSTCVKHYALNNQEYERGSIDIQCDERTMREMDLRVFEAAIVQGGAWSVMAAYNKVNGQHCSENTYLQQTILKKEWGFKGCIISDWGAVHSTVESANNGLDVEMPGPGWFWGKGKLEAAVREGKVSQATIDDKVRRVLYTLINTGAMDGKPLPEFNLHSKQALEAAQAGIVLLKNDKDLLPLAKAKSIALLGPFGDDSITGGGGSSHVDPAYVTTVRQGLEEGGYKGELKTKKVLDWEGNPSSEFGDSLNPRDGWKTEFFRGTSLQGTPIKTRTDAKIDFDWQMNPPDPDVPQSEFSVRWTGIVSVPETGTYAIRMSSDDGCRVIVDDKKLIDEWHDRGESSNSASVDLERGKPCKIVVEAYNKYSLSAAHFAIANTNKAYRQALELAKTSEMAVVVVGNSWVNESEGFDRNPMALPGKQEQLINDVLKVNPKTVVVLIGGSQQCFGDWWDRVPAIVEAWYPGMEGGRAVANILLGKVNPSGKLPMSFFRKWEDHPCFKNYPGNVYSEGILLGYRWLDAKKIKPLYPFGYGLSYTTYAYSGIEVKPAGMESVKVSFEIKNTGKVNGAEVAQVYVRPINPPVEKAPQALEGFTKVFLKAGEKKRVTVTLPVNTFWRFSPEKQAWIMDKGTYEIAVGASSRDIRLTGKIVKKVTSTFPGGITQTAN